MTFETRHYDICIERIGPDRWSVRTEPDSGLDGELVRDGDTYDLLIESNRWLSRRGFATWEEAVQIIF